MEMLAGIIFFWDLVTDSFRNMENSDDKKRKQHLANVSKGGPFQKINRWRNSRIIWTSNKRHAASGQDVERGTGSDQSQHPQPLTQIKTSGTRRTVWTKHHTFNHHRRSTPRDHGKIGNDYHHHQRHSHILESHTQRHTLNRINRKVMLHVMYPSVTRKEMF